MSLADISDIVWHFLGVTPLRPNIDNDDLGNNSNNSDHLPNFNNEMNEMQSFIDGQFAGLLKNFKTYWFSELNVPPTEGMEDVFVERDEENPRNRYVKAIKNNLPSNSLKINNDEWKEKHLDNYDDPDVPQDVGPIPSEPHSISVDTSPSGTQVIKTRKFTNGGVEEKRFRFTDGGKETTVSRQLGNKKHIITTLKKADGNETVSEEFVNMNRNSLREFNIQWAT